MQMSFKVFNMKSKAFTTTAIYFLLGLVIAAVGRPTQARDLVDMSLEITTESRGAEAKQFAFEQATERATLKVVQELLGADKANRTWPTIKSKILKNSRQYVVFIKGSPPVVVRDGTQITVALRISPGNLEVALREAGALSTGPLRVLSLVSFTNSRGMVYTWWSDTGDSSRQVNDPNLSELFKRFSVQLNKKMKAKNVFVLDPTSQSFRMGVPPMYRLSQLTREDQMALAEYLKADVVLSGRVESAKQRAENSELQLVYDLQMWQAKSGRNVAEFQKSERLTADTSKVILTQFEATAPLLLEDVANRLNMAVVAGNLNLNVVRIAVSGSMTYRQQAEFKRQLSQLRDIKVLKERLFEPNRVIFEAETSISGQDLGKVLQRAQFPLYQVKVDGAQDDSLALSVRAYSSSSAQ